MTHTIEKFPSLSVCVEYDPETTQKLGFRPQELLDFFRSRKYRLYILTQAATELADDDAVIQQLVNQSGYLDLLCSKSIIA